MVHWDVLAKALAAKAYLHEKGIGYLMVDSRGRSLQTLSKRDYRSQTAAKILSAIHENGVIKYKAYKSLISGEIFSPLDLYSLIIRENLALQVKPFRLSKLPDSLEFAPLL